MKIDENRLIEYLDSHIGENTRTLDLARKFCTSCENEGFSMDLKTDSEIRRIALKHRYRSNNAHHDNDDIGMPWVIDFFIEDSNVERGIRRINRPFQLKMKLVLIKTEYGIYDDLDDLLIVFRLSIPWQIKKLYDKLTSKIEFLESDGRIID